MEVLIVHRELSYNYVGTTTLKNQDNKVMVVFSKLTDHPRKGKKEITVKGRVYKLDWSKTN